MDIKQIECFIAVAEELHFGRAAQRLHMTQPPLSRQIQLLEQTLDVALFDRNSRTVQLTTAGHNFLNDAKRIIQLTKQAAIDVKRISSGETGQIKLGFTAGASYEFMPKLLMKMNKRYPLIGFQLREHVSKDLEQLLLSGELDVVLTRMLPRQDAIHVRLIEREKMLVALPAHSELLNYDVVPLQALHQQAFIMYTPNEGGYLHHRIHNGLMSINVAPRYVQMATQSHTVLMLIRAGLGVGIVPESAQVLQLDGVEFRPVSPDIIHAELFVGWKANNKNPAIESFIQTAFEDKSALR